MLGHSCPVVSVSFHSVSIRSVPFRSVAPSLRPSVCPPVRLLARHSVRHAPSQDQSFSVDTQAHTCTSYTQTNAFLRRLQYTSKLEQRVCYTGTMSVMVWEMACPLSRSIFQCCSKHTHAQVTHRPTRFFVGYNTRANSSKLEQTRANSSNESVTLAI